MPIEIIDLQATSATVGVITTIDVACVVVVGTDEAFANLARKRIGIAAMTTATPIAADMGPSTALRSIAFPLHPGAASYWEEVGLQLPAAARP